MKDDRERLRHILEAIEKRLESFSVHGSRFTVDDSYSHA